MRTLPPDLVTAGFLCAIIESGTERAGLRMQVATVVFLVPRPSFASRLTTADRLRPPGSLEMFGDVL
jgi:hypothetical protein